MYTFEIKKKIRGVTITDDIVNELKETGRSHIMKFKDSKGKQYLAHLEVSDGQITVVPEAKHLKHRCPHCGGRVLITGKGFACENSLGSHHTCKFHCKGILSHRFVQPHEMEAYLDAPFISLCQWGTETCHTRRLPQQPGTHLLRCP